MLDVRMSVVISNFCGVRDYVYPREASRAFNQVAYEAFSLWKDRLEINE